MTVSGLGAVWFTLIVCCVVVGLLFDLNLDDLDVVFALLGLQCVLVLDWRGGNDLLRLTISIVCFRNLILTLARRFERRLEWCLERLPQTIRRTMRSCDWSNSQSGERSYATRATSLPSGRGKLAQALVLVLALLLEPVPVAVHSPVACSTLAFFELGNTNLSRP